jgi:hypothetical protein
MMESVTYRAIFEEGFAKGWAKGERKAARKILLLLGRDQLGEPSAGVQATLAAIADVDRLEYLIVRLKHAASWQELLGLS